MVKSFTKVTIKLLKRWLREWYNMNIYGNVDGIDDGWGGWK